MQTTNFAAIFQGMPQPYLVLDPGLTIVAASDAYLSLTSRARNDIVGRHILEAFPENPEAAGTVEQGPLEVSLRHALATGKPHEMAVIQYDIPQPGGGFSQKFWTPVHTPVIGDDGHVQYIIQNPMDVTDRVLKAREADTRLRIALHAADLATWEYEPETDIWRRSNAVDEMFGFLPGEGGPVAAPFFARIHPEDLAAVQEGLRRIQSSPDQTAARFDYRIVLPTGGVRHVESRGEVLRTSDGKVRMIGVLMDVTTERQREAALTVSVKTQGELLEQKDALLAEVNHRVKNSLQLVVSTLRLQARRLRDSKTKEAFDQAISRVRAVISVHEHLYRTANSLTVDMADHLTKLCLDITNERPSRPIAVEVEQIELPTERAIPLSIIVNELVTAALKAAPAHGSRLLVKLRELPEDGVLALSVTNPDPRQSDDNGLSDLGSKLVTSMTAQIRGVFIEEEDPTQGFRATVTFPRELS
ncbi:two-component sensor histidine kinase [Rhizobium sp. BK181]|uniref:sensor histidine kinase n=1 Tax=Rhizobium sp. BK181 TaxID=2587072 RepID=UPI00161C4F47|nr:histidine kinase dimerization/phosphoacceptor domain -containing protein [Rhizobium sp. BK181]MBB3317635.1 two-component sensor histidine kinase [Rhizobium sp. BK181]